MELPIILQKKLLKMGYTEEQISSNTTHFEEQAIEYINLKLGDIPINDVQKQMIVENYIHYQLFAFVENDNLVKDKKDFIDSTLNSIIKLHNENKTDKSKKKGIMVL